MSISGRPFQDLRQAVVKAASIDANSGNNVDQRGVIWCSLFLLRQDSQISVLFASYLYAGHAPSLGVVENWRDGPGHYFTASGADAAAGAEVADTVPTGAMWKIYAAEVVLVTTGVANRNTALFIDDAGATITRRLLLTDTTNQTDAQTRTHGWYPGTAAVDAASVSITDTVTLLAKFPETLPVGPLDEADNIRSVTTGIQAGDNYGVARYIVEEWLKQR